MQIIKELKKEGFKVVKIEKEETIKYQLNPIEDSNRDTIKKMFNLTEEELVKKEELLYDMTVSEGYFVFLSDAVFLICEGKEDIKAITCINKKGSDDLKDKSDFINTFSNFAIKSALEQAIKEMNGDIRNAKLH